MGASNAEYKVPELVDEYFPRTKKSARDVAKAQVTRDALQIMAKHKGGHSSPSPEEFRKIHKYIISEINDAADLNALDNIYKQFIASYMKVPVATTRFMQHENLPKEKTEFIYALRRAVYNIFLQSEKVRMMNSDVYFSACDKGNRINGVIAHPMFAKVHDGKVSDIYRDALVMQLQQEAAQDDEVFMTSRDVKVEFVRGLGSYLGK